MMRGYRRDRQLRRRPVEIERTSKKWKALMLLSGLGMIGGCSGVLAGATAQEPNGALVAIGGGLALLALLVFVFAKIMAWWYHG